MITLLMLAPMGVPVAAAGLYAAVGWRPGTRWVSAGSAAAMLGAAVLTCVQVVRAGPRVAMGGLFRVDALSGFMLLVIAIVALIATAATPAHLQEELRTRRMSVQTCTQHSILVQLFLAVMAAAVLAANLGIMWVAIEATTVVTAFLVGQRRSRAAVEAAWKYVVICSTGIALALLGIVLLNDAARHLTRPVGLDWTGLMAAAPHLDPGVTRIAVVLLVLGFGTKAGLAPLHAWLPDAHSQAPAPVSALMSGVLLSVAFYAILRTKAIADITLGPGLTRGLLIVIGLASLAVAGSLLLAQRDLKRMLAYSSIEHMGLMALGAAIGTPLALTAVLLHILGHGLAKSVLFLSAGQVLQRNGTTRIEALTALADREPAPAACIGLGVLALIGLPPFSLFASELGIFRAGFGARLGWVMAAALILVVVIAAALFNLTSRMLLGRSTEPGVPSSEGSVGATVAAVLTRPATDTVIMVGALVGCAVIGISSWPLSHLLQLAAATLTGAP
jgi:hydrogenase-4 component F